MYFVYVLKNMKGECYYGYTNDLDRRISEHNKEEKWRIVYYEAYFSEKDARGREQKLKNYGKTTTELYKRIRNSLDQIDNGAGYKKI